MACVTTKHGKTAIDYYDENKRRHTIKFDDTKEQALIRLAEILKEEKKSVNTNTTFKGELAERLISEYVKRKEVI